MKIKWQRFVNRWFIPATSLVAMVAALGAGKKW
jgi:hypothetical protein